MGFFDFLKNNEVEGMIGYFGLVDWWINDLSEEERNYIYENQNSLGGDKKSLIKGSIVVKDITVINFLLGFVDYSNKDISRSITNKIFKKIESLMDDNIDIIDLHLLYNSKIKFYYKQRNIDDIFFKKAMQSCVDQINIAPRAMKGFIRDYEKIFFHTDIFSDDLKVWDSKQKKYVKSSEREYNFQAPSHTGYEQLAIVKEKQGDFIIAIKLAEQAKKEGWRGDWNKRIERCIKKMNK